MRYWSAFLALCLLLGLSAGVRGLFRSWGVAPLSQESALRQAMALRIGYTVDRQRRSITVSDPEELRGLLDSLAITNSVKGMAYPGWKAQGTVDFILADGTVLPSLFIYNTQLERTQWGHLYVKKDFYDRVCALLTRVERKPIDVLKNNK